VRDDINFRVGGLVNLAQEFPPPFAHHDEPRGKPRQLPHHPPLLVIRLAQHRVQRGHDRHPQLTQQGEDVAARGPAEDAKLVLHTKGIHPGDVEEIGGAQIRRQILLGDLETDLRRVIVAVLEVVHRHDRTLNGRKRGRDGAAQVRREGGNAAFARQVISEERDFAETIRFDRAHGVRNGPQFLTRAPSAVRRMEQVPMMVRWISFNSSR
jgi:hypothetical protein